MTDHEDPYLPATRHEAFLPFYDLIVRVLFRGSALRRKSLEQAEIGRDQQILDLGRGTGTMAILIRQRRPDCTVLGVDGDPKVLAIARRKAARRSLPIRFDEAMADHLPYPDRSFDRVLSSLVLHHLTDEGKIGALREARRVLKPGGSFHLADFGPPVGWFATVAARLVSHGGHLDDNLEGRLPRLMADAGFETIEARGHLNTIFGTVVFLSASVPGQ
jgi:ubiquinone/menaquinone biosynthesis C-methylase UbiE